MLTGCKVERALRDRLQSLVLRFMEGRPLMGYSLKQFSSECRRILEQDPGVEGRKKVCALVKDVLKDDDFVAMHLGDDVPDRKVLY